MTSRTTLKAPSGLDEDTNLRPVPWRRMAWVTWRQHRSALIGVAVVLGALALYLWIVGRQLHHAYGAAVACRPASLPACADLVHNFNGIGDFLTNGLVLQLVPGLIGAFVGAPVLAREFEAGTFRFAWTQGFGRWRWTLAKLVGLGVVVVAAAGAISVLASWYYQPYFAAGNGSLSLTELNSLSPRLFDLRGFAFAAWTLTAFAIGALAGTLIRRVVPAIVVTLAAYAGLAVAAGGYLRQHYLTPLVTNSTNVPGSAWILSQHWTTNGGRPVSQSVIDQVLTAAPSQVGKGGTPKASITMQYLAQHGYTQVATYQPASRFWAFQWIEGGWLLALSVLLIAATVWLVRRRAA